MTKELLIFGAGGALGTGITESLSKKDFDKIYLFDRHIDGLEINSNKIEKIQVEDLSNEYSVINAFKSITPSKVKLFFLYSTVGGFTGGKTTWESGIDELNKMLDMNLKSSFLIAKHFSLLVKNSAGGSILFTAALTGLEPESKKGVYGLSKAALIHLVETLALEGKDINLTANAIAPYIIDTPANREWMKNKNYDNLIKSEEIGELAYDIFRNFHFISGNIIKLTNRLEIS